MHSDSSVHNNVDTVHKLPENISLWIDSYSDIFSDFDPRPFTERALSDDFIAQVKKVSRETKGKINLVRLLVPVGTRKEEHERTIRKRISDYFDNIHEQLQREVGQLRKKGSLFILAGILFMVTASYISFLKPTTYFFYLLLVLLEPGGWFLLWNGLDHFFTFSRIKKTESTFYSRIVGAHIEFVSYK